MDSELETLNSKLNNYIQMNKSKETIQTIVQYLRELSIVVAGIAITVGIGFYVNNNNYMKDQRQYLNAIKMELEENAKKFDDYAKWLQKQYNYMEYIRSNDLNSMSQDSINYYVVTDEDGCGIFFYESVAAKFPTNAFEMFKSSGAMRQIESKELLQSIWDVYVQIESSKLSLDRFFQLKQEESMKYINLYVEDKVNNVIPMQSFHTSGIPFTMVMYCTETSEYIKETLLKFE